jgi:hypothetical protein
MSEPLGPGDPNYLGHEALPDFSSMSMPGGDGQSPTGPPGFEVPVPGDPAMIAAVLDLMEDETARAAEREEMGNKAPKPGEKGPQTLYHELGEGNLQKLATELADVLLDYDQTMGEKWQLDDKVEDAYSMLGDADRGGSYPGAAEMVSEMTMSACDQAKARIVSALLDVTPVMKVDPILSEGFQGQEAMDRAKATEQFLQNYGHFQIKISDKLPMAILRAVKIGTSVVHPHWKTCIDEVKYYDDDGKIKKRRVDKSGVVWDLIRNKDVICWPPWISDWQDGYEVVGHREWLTVGQWRKRAKELGVGDTLRQQVENYAVSDADIEAPERQGVKAASVVEVKGMVRLANLYCYRLIPGREQPLKFQVIMHEELRKILWMDYNLLHSQKHPYIPIRYKRVDGSAWGVGLGHEIVYTQAADTSLWNLEIDNLFSSAFAVTLLRSGSNADQLMDRPFPGARIATDDPEGDLITKSLSVNGPLEMIYQARSSNEQRKTNATGLAPVLAGQGDPTMKSGGGTGAIMALIEQAGKKFGDVDKSVRYDLTNLYEFTLDLVAQNAATGTFYVSASEEDASKLAKMKYVPVQGSVSEHFKIWAHAPSAANNAELRKNMLLVVYNFLMQHISMEMQYAQPIYQAENPSGYTGFLREALEKLNEMGRRVLLANEVPAVDDLLPSIAPATPAEQRINELMKQLEQSQNEIAGLQQQLNPQPMPPEMGGTPMPEGQPPQGAPPPGMMA